MKDKNNQHGHTAVTYQPTDSQQRRFPGSNVRSASQISTSGRGLASDWESGVRLDADWKPSSSDWSKLDGTCVDRDQVKLTLKLW